MRHSPYLLPPGPRAPALAPCDNIICQVTLLVSPMRAVAPAHAFGLLPSAEPRGALGISFGHPGRAVGVAVGFAGLSLPSQAEL